MTRLTTTHTVDADGLAGLRQPRADLLVERADGADRWVVDEGPFRSYERSLSVRPTGTDHHEVTEVIDYRLAIPLWGPLFQPLMRRALRSTERRPRSRWWWPREVVTEQTATLVAVLVLVSLMTGYLGVVISQTITFAARDFGSGDSAVANTLAFTRIGVLVAVVFLHRADRVGRRPLVVGFALGAIAFTAVGALAPDLTVLGVLQAIARGLTTGLITLLVLATTEEVPAGVRAFTISLISIAAALGAGMVVWVVPIDDVIPSGWRVVYLVPLLFLGPLWWVARTMPETRRFAAAVETGAPAVIDWRRFTLLGTSAFLSGVFLSPASQLRGEFLRDDLGYSASLVSLFQVVTSTPAGPAIVAAGVAADRFGRKVIGSTGLAVGAVMLAVSYQLGGTGLWVTGALGIILTGAAIPATRGYQTELFPTRTRAKVGGLLDIVGVAGSAVGLVAVGWLVGRGLALGDAIGSMIWAALLVAAAILFLFPETAAVELEEFNPDDPTLDRERRSGGADGGDRSDGERRSGREQDPAGLGQLGDP